MREEIVRWAINNLLSKKNFKWLYLNLDWLRKPRSKWLSQIFPLAVLMGLHCFCATSITFAETWALRGPEGGDVRAFAVDPVTPGTVYAGSFGGGVFKSQDGGAKWRAVNAGLTNQSVLALAIDPATPSTVYAGTSWGAFKSDDGGDCWTDVNTGLTDLGILTLVVDLSSSKLYAGTFGGGVFSTSLL